MLLELPKVVWDVIFKNLNAEPLKILRLTCKKVHLFISTYCLAVNPTKKFYGIVDEKKNNQLKAVSKITVRSSRGFSTEQWLTNFLEDVPYTVIKADIVCPEGTEIQNFNLCITGSKKSRDVFAIFPETNEYMGNTSLTCESGKIQIEFRRKRVEKGFIQISSSTVNLKFQKGVNVIVLDVLGNPCVLFSVN